MTDKKTCVELMSSKGLLAYTMSIPNMWLLIALSTLHHIITVGVPFFLIFMMSQLWFINDPTTYIKLAIGFLIIGSLWLVTSYIKDKVFYNLLLKYSTKISDETVKLLLSLPYSYIGNLPIESQFSRFSPLENLSYIWLNSIVKPLLDLPLIIIAFSIICFILGFTYFSYISVVIFSVIILNKFKNKATKATPSKVSESMFHGTLKDVMNNMGVIKAHNRTTYFHKKTKDLIENKIVGKYVSDTKSAVLSNISETMLLFLYIGSLTFSVYYALNGYIEIRLLIVILLLTWFSIAPFKLLIGTISEIPKAKDLLKQFGTLRSINQSINRHKKHDLNDNFEGELELKGVNMNFTNGSRFILTNISFMLHRGELLVLNGPSGSGKSSLLKLISGLYRPSSGLLSIDQDINLLDPDSLQEKVLLVTSDSYFTNSTIKTNLKLTNYENIDNEMEATLSSLGINTTPDSSLINNYPICDFKKVHSDKISYQEITNKIILSKVNPNIKGKVILFDEPILNYKKDEFEYLAKLIKKIKEHNTIIISSRYNFYAPLASKIILMNNGKIEKYWEKK